MISLHEIFRFESTLCSRGEIIFEMNEILKWFGRFVVTSEKSKLKAKRTFTYSVTVSKCKITMGAQMIHIAGLA